MEFTQYFVAKFIDIVGLFWTTHSHMLKIQLI